VIDYKLKKRANPIKMKEIEDDEKHQLRKYVWDIANENYETIIDPTAPSISSAIPKEFAISRSYIDYLGDIINAVCLFNYKERIKTKIGHYFIAPEDTWTAWEIYGKDFIESCLKIPSPLGREVLTLFPKVSSKLSDYYIPAEHEMLTEAQVTQKLKEMGFLLERFNVRPILAALLQNSMLDTDTEQKKGAKKYFLSEFLSGATEIDWKTLIKETKTLMYEEYAEIADDYIERFCCPQEIRHPIDGRTITIFGDDMIEYKEEVVVGETPKELPEKMDINLEDFE
jgi:hypothetical protein